jgi:hypothetical protein
MFETLNVAYAVILLLGGLGLAVLLALKLYGHKPQFETDAVRSPQALEIQEVN